MGGGSAARAAGTRRSGGRVAGARTRFGLEMAAETFVPASHFTSGMSSAFQLLRALQPAPLTFPYIIILLKVIPEMTELGPKLLDLGALSSQVLHRYNLLWNSSALVHVNL